MGGVITPGSVATNTFVNSLTFRSSGNAGTPVSINGTNTLTIKASGINYAAGTGIVVNPGSAVTIGTPVSVFSSQTWTSNLANTFTASGNIALAANTLTIDGSGDTALTGVVSGTGGITKAGTGSAQLTAANTYIGVTTVKAGTLTVQAAAFAPILTNAGGADIRGDKLVLDYSATGSSPIAQVKSTLEAGYTADFATGQFRDTALTAGRTLGYGDNGSAVTVMLTLAGDANLDGAVNFNDFLILQNNFGKTDTRFDQGKFNYDTAADFNDFLQLQNSFGKSVSGAVVAVSVEEVAALNVFASMYAGVPEPNALAVLGLGAAGLLRRRRRA